MSAYVQSKAHIDALVRLGLEGPTDKHGHALGRWERDVRWYTETPGGGYVAHRLTYDTADEVGALLVAENVASVAHLYSEDPATGVLPGPIDAYYREPYTYALGRRLTAAEAVMAIRGYEYQACERPAWSTSAAKGYCDHLRNRILDLVVGDADSEFWSIGD